MRALATDFWGHCSCLLVTAPGAEMVCLSALALAQSIESCLRIGLLAAFESMRGGGRIRPIGGWPSDRLLKEPRLPARLTFGDSGGVTAGAAVARLGSVGVCLQVNNDLLDEAAGAHTWSAN